MEPIETLNKSVKLQSDGKVSVDASDHADDLLDVGYMEYGCQHYQRRCRIRAPCCNEIFDCHHCHNEAMNNINLEKTKRHDIPRHQVHQTSKKQYHCDGCGICRIGGRENFFHCYKCGCCYSVVLKNSHPCIEGAMHHDCPVCFEYLFESRNDVTVLPCGHTIHKKCLDEMQEHCQFACPLCSKSVCDMSKVWEKFDVEIAATPMPEPYQNKMVSILCNDCESRSCVQYHIVAQKCPNCKSYNTRQLRS
ncbi:probable E3 ubiquitin-protein ligase RZFP34 isoform X3 [Beta vulgaris subsp. vulgaris]|uniref:probable E3 ubiquitin-protein ligase RZFP34 isoform X3 n=1 Tax=Beta vulgaris subsp. vulgaris TaxID=3555 RepID=UPI00203693F1|nr:probable E3 ubiquitin-protein ligase RZFP34 isoform X3 [Beta vulgaris subsp. vulgaris]